MQLLEIKVSTSFLSLLECYYRQHLSWLLPKYFELIPPVSLVIFSDAASMVPGLSLLNGWPVPVEWVCIILVTLRKA